MTWKVHVDRNALYNSVSLTFGKKTDSGLLVAKPIQVEYEIAPQATYIEPAIRIPDDLARELLEALNVHYGGVSDVRTLREDYLNERKRVDKFIDKVIGSLP